LTLFLPHRTLRRERAAGQAKKLKRSANFNAMKIAKGETSMQRELQGTFSRLMVMAFAYGLAVLLVLAGSTAWAKGGSKPSSGCPVVNVTGAIFNTDASMRGYQIQSDDLAVSDAVYPSAADLTDYVGGFTCQWDLDTTSSVNPPRYVSLSFEGDSQLGYTLPAGLAPGVEVQAQIIARCPNGSGGNLDWTEMSFASHETDQCALSVTFSSGGTSYTLKMNPSVYAGTSSAAVQCTDGPISPNPGTCGGWSVSPGMGAVTSGTTGQTSAVGQLFKILKGGKTSSQGYYLFDFYMTVHE
jgi:hypothetical protein